MEEYKIYRVGNYIKIVNIHNYEIFNGAAKEVFVDSSNVGKAEYRFFNVKNWKETKSLKLNQIKKQDGTAYTLAEWESFYTDNTVINIAPALLSLINSAIQPNEENTLQKIAAENIPSHTPIAIVDNKAYKFDSSNINHQFAFAGFSKNGAITGQICIIQYQGEIELVGWGLIPNSQYLAGTSGTIVLDNTTSNSFTKVVGYATTTDTLQIIKDFSSVN